MYTHQGISQKQKSKYKPGKLLLQASQSDNILNADPMYDYSQP
jgi:hypothetical protein